MALALRVGEVVADKYRIVRQLGSGGMGVVVEATHLHLNQPVALKFLVESALEPEIATERFLREAQATFRLRSEHTVRVMDVGRLASGEPFMVMELLVGKDFKQLLVERGPLPPAEAAQYMLQLCSALQEAHALGIIHRDLKARNLYLTTRADGTPCVKVLDFGISKLSDGGEAAPLTQANMGMGSPRYMAPEQWVSASTVDARADIYAAGAVFYELITGNIPLAGLPLPEVIKRIRAGAVPSPKEQRPELPEPICRVVMRALRPRPEERFPTVMHFAQAIRDAMPEASAAPRPRPVMSMTVPTAVVNREALLARAQLDAHFAATSSPSSSAPTPKDAAPPTIGEEPVASSTLDEGVPAAQEPITSPLPKAPQARDANAFEEDVATIVSRSPVEEEPSRRPQHATLQVAEAPPELQALRNKYATSPAPPAPPVSGPAPPAPPLASLFDETLAKPSHPVPPAPPAAVPRPPPMRLAETVDDVARARATPPRRGIPAWLFWVLLVVSFCMAGGVAAALLTRFLP